MDRHGRTREGGIAVLVAMMMLLLMGMVGLASLETVMRSRQMTGFHNLTETALHAADAGVADSLDILRTDAIVSGLAAGDCLDTTLPTTDLGGGRSYEADPSAGQICMLASAEPCGSLDSSIEVGQPMFLYTVWNIRVQGNAPGGATARVQATAARCHPFSN